MAVHKTTQFTTSHMSSTPALFQPKIIVHLGAAEVPERFIEETLRYAKMAVEAGAAAAREKKPAEDIVAAAVKVLEDCPVTDAGIGSVFNAEGKIQMDAGLMTGDKRFGAVTTVHNIRNPILAARAMVDDTRFSILSSEGAMAFIRKHGFEMLPDEAFVTEYNKFIQEQVQDPLDLFVNEHGTVGCAARDVFGNIAAGTSTGGTPLSPPGRVGDSSYPGSGVWADNADGAVSCTGYGESILVDNLAARAAMRLTKMDPMRAAKEAITAFSKRSPRSVGGLIMISKETGEYGFAHNTVHLPYALLNEDGTITSGLTAPDLQ